jgi:hypothetical protein
MSLGGAAVMLKKGEPAIRKASRKALKTVPDTIRNIELIISLR